MYDMHLTTLVRYSNTQRDRINKSIRIDREGAKAMCARETGIGTSSLAARIARADSHGAEIRHRREIKRDHEERCEEETERKKKR